MKLSATFSVLAAVLPYALAQSQEWGQCGGIGWTGPTTCVAGTVCTVMNAYYSQCLPGSASPSPTSTPAAPPTSTPPTSTSAPAPSGSGLNKLAQAAGKKYFGTATDNSELTDTAYTAILDNIVEFGQLTAANSMKWDATEPTRGTFTFSSGDQIANLAKANGQLLRGHNCVWYNQLPSWVSNGQFTAADLTTVIQNHCGTLVGHYKGQVYSWDVINEPFNDDGTWRTDVFYNTLGTSYVEIALNAARAADPNAKLYINDYNIEQTGAKATAMLNLVKSLKSSGVPIDGVGFQCHFIVGEVPTSFQSVLEQFTAAGVEVAITELDIRMPTPASQANLQQQQKDYQSVVQACKNVEGCVGITLWDFTDKYSWVPSTFSGQGAACPWDQNLVKKPAYSGIVAAL
ncbi:endo-1,4-B-xylanase A [Dichomitus squalens LYAD-421 SS1]|uniref:endo-1,4-B-xylanase A n=1 Tax=Dichomitus squalens (strain LYAD-421) TaxID=732165 RepID=UPI0004414788|nr:endo-1,4-B-xylanase A [Dichomitus squalens LYAD-421 SS1]EJF64841.1 endo-1,4-B-xylanase A [Dichomitus squalens LYAD-421 SS1]